MTGRRRSPALLLGLLAGVLGLLGPLGLFGVVGPAPVAEASCAYSPDAPENAQRADVIFTGEVVGDRSGHLGAQRELIFRVDQVYKGEAYAEQLVISSNLSEERLAVTGTGPFLVLAQYDSPPKPGQPAGTLTSDGCSGTRAGAAPASLGTGKPPVAGSSARANQHSGLLIGVGVLFVIGAVVVSRRAARRRGAP